MTQVKLEIKGLEELRQALNESGPQMRIVLNDALREVGSLLVPAKGTGPLADATPVVTGNLARSTYYRIEQGINNQTLAIRQPAKSIYGQFYGHFVRGGTSPHTIAARFAKALHFWIGDVEIFAKSVDHPGTTANPYHVGVLNDKWSEIMDILTSAAEALQEYLAGRK